MRKNVTRVAQVCVPTFVNISSTKRHQFVLTDSKPAIIEVSNMNVHLYRYFFEELTCISYSA